MTSLHGSTSVDLVRPGDLHTDLKSLEIWKSFLAASPIFQFSICTYSGRILDHFLSEQKNMAKAE